MRAKLTSFVEGCELAKINPLNTRLSEIIFARCGFCGQTHLYTHMCSFLMSFIKEDFSNKKTRFGDKMNVARPRP